MRAFFKIIVRLILLAIAVLLIVFFSRSPRNDREWMPDFATLPEITIEGDQLSIRHIRNSRYDAEARATVAHYDRTFDLNRLESVWFVLSPFREDWRGPAHSFLSFGFADSSYLAVSVEARKEIGESYTVWKGLYRNFELIYVIGDERDLIPLRTNIWKDDVFVYPAKTNPEKTRELLLDVLARTIELQEKPEFYNTLTQNCTSALGEHVNRIAPGKVPNSWKLIITGYSDELALDAGLIDWDGDIESARERFRVNEKAMLYADDPRFSTLIRESD
ncbi:DUF4105 domain-containing protein [bacterium]|nr:DUF4105 domain-containing protein [bacterium]